MIESKIAEMLRTYPELRVGSKFELFDEGVPVVSLKELKFTAKKVFEVEIISITQEQRQFTANVQGELVWGSY